MEKEVLSLVGEIRPADAADTAFLAAIAADAGKEVEICYSDLVTLPRLISALNSAGVTGYTLTRVEEAAFAA